MLFSMAVNTVTAKKPRQMGTGSARTSRLPIQHASIWRPQPGYQALLPTGIALQPTSLGHGELQSQCSSNWHHLRSYTRVSENSIRSCETRRVGKGDRQLPQTSTSAVPSASFHTERRVWWTRETPKLRESHRMEIAQQIRHVVEKAAFHSAV